jgi:hypothetical protein
MYGFCLDLALELHLFVRRGVGYVIAESAPFSAFVHSLGSCVGLVLPPIIWHVGSSWCSASFDSQHSSILLGTQFLIHGTLCLLFMYYCIITIHATGRHLTIFMIRPSLHYMKNSLEGVGHCWNLMNDELTKFPVLCTATIRTRGFSIFFLILRSLHCKELGASLRRRHWLLMVSHD